MKVLRAERSHDGNSSKMVREELDRINEAFYANDAACLGSRKGTQVLPSDDLDSKENAVKNLFRFSEYNNDSNASVGARLSHRATGAAS